MVLRNTEFVWGSWHAALAPLPADKGGRGRYSVRRV